MHVSSAKAWMKCGGRVTVQKLHFQYTVKSSAGDRKWKILYVFACRQEKNGISYRQWKRKYKISQKRGHCEAIRLHSTLVVLPANVYLCNRILPLFRKAFTHFSGKSLSGKHKNMGIVKSCKYVIGFFLILQNDRRA